jgi:hypothetical protein
VRERKEREFVITVPSTPNKRSTLTINQKSALTVRLVENLVIIPPSTQKPKIITPVATDHQKEK